MPVYSEDEMVPRGADDGSSSFPKKPFDMKTLARKIRKTLARARR